MMGRGRGVCLDRYSRCFGKGNLRGGGAIGHISPNGNKQDESSGFWKEVEAMSYSRHWKDRLMIERLDARGPNRTSTSLSSKRPNFGNNL